jgi:RNA polymerase sigma factor (sigma-70 family)
MRQGEGMPLRRPPDEGSDEELLAAATTDKAAFLEFYDRHVEQVIAFGVRRLGDSDQVADLVAEVFLAVLRSAGSYDPRRGTARAWLYGIAANVVAGGRRRAAKEAGAYAQLSGRRLLEPDDYAELDSRLDAASAARRLSEAMARVPRADRVVLELVALDQLTVTEAAAALGIRPGAARSRLARARRRLRADLTDPDPAAAATGAPGQGRRTPPSTEVS